MVSLKKILILFSAATFLAIGFAPSTTPAAAWGYSERGYDLLCPPGYHLGYMGRYCHPNRYWW